MRESRAENRAPAAREAELRRLERAYRRTSYRAQLPLGGELCLRIDEGHERLDGRLARRGQRCWAYLHAVNPQSRQLSAEQNSRRHGQLAAELAALRGSPAGSAPLEILEGASDADDGDWPAEPGFLVLGLALERARALALDFGQLAFVAGQRGERARLHWSAAPA
jgi:hypothetical protein